MISVTFKLKILFIVIHIDDRQVKIFKIKENLKTRSNLIITEFFCDFILNYKLKKSFHFQMLIVELLIIDQ